MAHRTFHGRGMAAFAFLILASPGRCLPPGKDMTYVSPDRALQARVHTDSHGESSVCIETANASRILLIRDDTSKDGFHGYGVVHGAWSPDSQFFVAGLESTGGHQPWSHPIWVYSRASNHVVELSTLGLTVVATFQLRPPDILKTRVLDSGSSGRRTGQPLAVSLNTLLKTGHATNK